MDPLDAYLEELVSHLDCDPLRRDEIRLEVHGHLRQLVEDHEREGMAAGAAAAAALAAFGEPQAVAARLTEANQGRPPRLRPVALPTRVWAVAVAFVARLGISYGLGFIRHFVFMAAGLSQTVTHSPSAMTFATVGLERMVEGCLITLLVWRISRRPWDALLVWAAGLLLEIPAVAYSLYMISTRGPNVSGWTIQAELTFAAILTGALLAATALTALLLSRGPKSVPMTRPQLSGGAGQRDGLAALDAYVSEVVAGLAVEPLRRDELRFEVHRRLRELAQYHRQRGMPAAEAVAAAMAHLGPAAVLAGRLHAADQLEVPARVERRVAAIAAGAVASAVALLLLDAATTAMEHGLFQAHGAALVNQWGLSMFHSVTYAAELLSAGALAVYVVWCVSRRHWDGLLSCLLALVVLVLMDKFPGIQLRRLISLELSLMYWAGATAMAAYLWKARTAPLSLAGRVDGDAEGPLGHSLSDMGHAT